MKPADQGTPILFMHSVRCRMAVVSRSALTKFMRRSSSVSCVTFRALSVLPMDRLTDVCVFGGFGSHQIKFHTAPWRATSFSMAILAGR